MRPRDSEWEGARNEVRAELLEKRLLLRREEGEAEQELALFGEMPANVVAVKCVSAAKSASIEAAEERCEFSEYSRRSDCSAPRRIDLAKTEGG